MALEAVSLKRMADGGPRDEEAAVGGIGGGPGAR